MKYREGIMEETEKTYKSSMSSIQNSDGISSDEDEENICVTKNVEESKIDNVTLNRVEPEEKIGKYGPENHAESSEKRESCREKKHAEVTEGLEPISSDEDEHTYDDPEDDDRRLDEGPREACFYSSTSPKGKAEKYSRAQRERSSTFYQRRHRTEQDSSVLTELRIVSETFMAKESHL